MILAVSRVSPHLTSPSLCRPFLVQNEPSIPKNLPRPPRSWRRERRLKALNSNLPAAAATKPGLSAPIAAHDLQLPVDVYRQVFSHLPFSASILYVLSTPLKRDFSLNGAPFFRLCRTCKDLSENGIYSLSKLVFPEYSARRPLQPYPKGAASLFLRISSATRQLYATNLRLPHFINTIQFVSFSQKLPKLTGPSRRSSTWFRSLAHPVLVSLFSAFEAHDLRLVDASALENFLSSHAHTLRKFSITGRSTLSDQQVADLLAKLANLTHLRVAVARKVMKLRLDLRALNALRDVELRNLWLAPGSFLEDAPFCPKESIKFSIGGNVELQSYFEAVARVNDPHLLHTLDLAQSSGVTSERVAPLAKATAGLKTLVLDNCRSLTLGGLLALLSETRGLEFLSYKTALAIRWGERMMPEIGRTKVKRLILTCFEWASEPRHDVMASFAALTSVEELDLSYGLTKVPKELLSLPKLRKLTMNQVNYKLDTSSVGIPKSFQLVSKITHPVGKNGAPLTVPPVRESDKLKMWRASKKQGDSAKKPSAKPGTAIGRIKK